MAKSRMEACLTVLTHLAVERFIVLKQGIPYPEPLPGSTPFLDPFFLEPVPLCTLILIDDDKGTGSMCVSLLDCRIQRFSKCLKGQNESVNRRRGWGQGTLLVRRSTRIFRTAVPPRVMLFSATKTVTESAGVSIRCIVIRAPGTRP